jgi:hypothetical protein
VTCFGWATRFGLALIDKCGGCGVPRLPLVGPALAGKSVCLGADCFAFGELLGKTPQVTKGACSWLGSSCVGIPSLRRRSVGPRRTDIHVLTALSPHPCGSAHCASSAFSLHPSRVLRRLDVLRMRIKSALKRIKGFPAEAGPTGVRGAFSGTGFSREERLPTADCFAFGELLGKTPQVTKGVCSWLGSSCVGVRETRRSRAKPGAQALGCS